MMSDSWHLQRLFTLRTNVFELRKVSKIFKIYLKPSHLCPEKRMSTGVGVKLSILALLSSCLLLVYNNCGKEISSESTSNYAQEEIVRKNINESPSNTSKVLIVLHESVNEAGVSSTSKSSNKKVIADMLRSKMQSSLKVSSTTKDPVHEYKNIEVVAAEIDEATLDQLLQSPMVKSIEPDEEIKIIMNDSNKLMEVNNAHAVYPDMSGKGVTAAVIDTGVQLSHPALQNRVVGGACFASDCNGEIGREAGNTCSGGACFHGSHVAGIIAANGDIKGVAHEANIYAIRVFGSSGSGSLSDALEALDHIYDVYDQHNIVSANMSLGGGQHNKICNDSFAPIIKKLYDVGVAVFVATGNDSYNHSLSSPACVPGVFRIGSSTKSDGISSFSNQTNWNSFIAPGSDIKSLNERSGYQTASGTSMATPNACGIYTALRSKFTDRSIEEITAAMTLSAAKINDSRIDYQMARPNLYWAAKALEHNKYAFTVHDEGNSLTKYLTLQKQGMTSSTNARATGGSTSVGTSSSKATLTFTHPSTGPYKLVLYHYGFSGSGSVTVKINGTDEATQSLDSGSDFTEIVSFVHNMNSQIEITGTNWQLDKVVLSSDLEYEPMEIARNNLNTKLETKNELEFYHQVGGNRALVKAHVTNPSDSVDYQWYINGTFYMTTKEPELNTDKVGNVHLRLRDVDGSFQRSSQEYKLESLSPTQSTVIQIETLSSTGMTLVATYNGSEVYSADIEYENQLHNIIIPQANADPSKIVLEVR